MKIGCPPSWRWGVPPLYASIDWARLLTKDFLEDWATVQRILCRVSRLRSKRRGGAGAINSLYKRFAEHNLRRCPRNADRAQIRPPVTGSAHLSRDQGQHSQNRFNRRVAQGFSGTGAAATSRRRGGTGHGRRSTETLLRDHQQRRKASTGPTELKFLGDAKPLDRHAQSDPSITCSMVSSGYAKRPDARSLWWEANQNHSDAGSHDLLNGIIVAGILIANNDEVNIIVRFPATEHDPSVMVDAWSHVCTLGGTNGHSCSARGRSSHRCGAGMLHEIGYEEYSATARRHLR